MDFNDTMQQRKQPQNPPSQGLGSSDPPKKGAPLTAPSDHQPAPAESRALQRRRDRIALIQEFGGHTADLKQAALEAIRRGMYSPRTSRSDVELSLFRTWTFRNRRYKR